MLQSKLLVQINEAFVTGLHHGVLFVAAATLLGVIIVLRYLPAHGTEVDGIPAATSAEELVDPTALDDYDDGHGEPAERAPASPTPDRTHPPSFELASQTVGI